MARRKKTETVVYTDGAGNNGKNKKSPNGYPGGWSWVAVKNDKIIDVDAGYSMATTSNNMEMEAIMRAKVKYGKKTIITDYKTATRKFRNVRWQRRGTTKWNKLADALASISMKKAEIIKFSRV